MDNVACIEFVPGSMKKHRIVGKCGFNIFRVAFPMSVTV